MIKSLHYLQSGFLSPHRFNQNEITKRCYTIDLSRYQDLENVHTGSVNTIDIEKSENRYLLSGCSDGSIYVHDVNNFTGKPVYTARCVYKIVKNSMQTHRFCVECVTWYGNDNALFISSGADKSLKIWDLNNLKIAEDFNLQGSIYHHDCTSVPTSNPVIAVASAMRNVKLIDLRTGSSVHELRGHKSSVFTCRWSPAVEHLLASGGLDNCILLWDIRSSKGCLKRLDKDNKDHKNGIAHGGFVNGLKFTADGLFLVSFGTDNKLRVWETLNGYNQEISFTKVKNNVKKNVQFAICDNSKPTLLYVPSQGTICVFEMLSGRLVKTLRGHFHSVNCCAYREPYQELYSGGNDKNILTWTPSQSEANDIDEQKDMAPSNTLKLDDCWSDDD